MDIHGAHTRPDVLEFLEKRFGTDSFFIDAGLTCDMQPLDVVFNKPLKDYVREAWDDWFKNGEKSYTKKGNRRAPSYQTIVDMISACVRRFDAATVRKAFRVCGFDATGQVVPQQ